MSPVQSAAKVQASRAKKSAVTTAKKKATVNSKSTAQKKSKASLVTKKTAVKSVPSKTEVAKKKAISSASKPASKSSPAVAKTTGAVKTLASRITKVSGPFASSKTMNGAPQTNGFGKTKVATQTNGARKDFRYEPMTVQRIKVEAEIFVQGDKVVYPAHGVGAVDAVQSRMLSGTEHKVYMITIIDTGMKIMVPVAQASTVGLRRVVDPKTVEEVYEILRDKNVVVDTQTWNRRYREYTQKIKTGSVFEIAKVVRDLASLKTDKELSFGERKMLDTASGLLVKEIAIAKSSPEEVVRQELDELCLSH